MMATYRTGLTVLALTGSLAAAGFAQQAHKGQAEHGHKMTMPAMNDGHFVDMMKKHHEDGIALSKLEESRGTRDDVKVLAAKIRHGQERDLEELNAKHAHHAGEPGGHDAAMQKHHAMMEHMASESMKKLENASGPAVDQAFLHEMTAHHRMALEMIAKTKFKDPDLRKLAQKMTAEQKREIQELKKLERVR